MYWSSYCGRINLNITLNNAKKAYHSGECDDSVMELSKKASIKKQTKTIDKAVLIDVLSEYGGWDENELADHDMNIQRLLWVACGDIVEFQVIN